MDDTIHELRNAFIVSDSTSTCEKLCRDCDEFMAEIVQQHDIPHFCRDTNSSCPYRYSPEIAFTPDSGVGESIPEFANAVPLLPLPSIDRARKSALTIALEKTSLNDKSLNKFNDYAIFDGRSAGGRSASVSNTQSSPRLRLYVIWFWRIFGLPKISFSVQPTSACTVRDLVGLSLWQYLNENPSAITTFNSESSHLEKDATLIIKQIDVYVYDPQEEVDDFPPIQPSDSIYKYDFDALALVENVTTVSPGQEVNVEPLVYVTVHLAQGISLVRFPASATLKRVLEEAINRRKLRQHEGYAYRLEEWLDTDKQSRASEDQGASRRPLDLSMTLAEYTKNNPRPHFVLIREHSRYDPVMGDNDRGSHASAPGDISVYIPTTSPSGAVTRNLQSRKYRATQLRGPNSRDVQLTVSRDRLDVQASRLPKIFRGGSKFLSVPMSHVVDCSLCSAVTTIGDLSNQPLSKVQFVILYLPPVSGQQGGVTSALPPSSSRPELEAAEADDERSRRFGLEDVVNLVFESQWTSARAICHQVNLIFSCCPSRIRDAYLNLCLSASQR
ncbi:Target of rapamycin complex 2 subunit MAPKAP1 [Taenia solium]|eukprot:TsM_000871400 transcript=TsM_000871400 gene=TsM_000871400